MSDVALRVEGLGKRYRVGVKGNSAGGMYRYKSLRDTFANLSRQPLQTLKSAMVRKPMNEENSFWALDDIHFEIRKGEVSGIIGRNGAGKSTLLKILSRITKPTAGRIELFGRVGSLLEVGTGFHPELTGRENIYLNGAILGMSQAEIRAQFDDIVSFSDIDRFLDTPVKQYSSGMYMRLAFAVAAHLRTEILVVDEVLSVGDVEFQNKCLGKMREVSENGRSVLVVSHNLGQIRSVCSTGLVLNAGRVTYQGSAREAIDYYTRTTGIARTPDLQRNFNGSLRFKIRFRSILINGFDPLSHNVSLDPTDPITIKLAFSLTEAFEGRVVVGFFRDGVRVATVFDGAERQSAASGEFQSEIVIASQQLRPGRYDLGIGAYSGTKYGEYIWGEQIGDFSISQVWSDRNDEQALGVVNLHYQGCRTMKTSES